MFVSLQEVKQTVYDVCVIEAGPGGIILALEFAKQQPGKRILLLEYGGESESPKNRLDDTIVIDNPTNHHLPYECTNKGLGGSSATWGGRCVMYDEIDFMPRAVVGSECTWGLDLWRDLQRYLKATAEYFECGAGEFELRDQPTAKVQPIAENFVAGAVVDTKIERWSMPTRFGIRYKPELSAARNIHVLTGWAATRFGIQDSNGNVPDLLISSQHGREQNWVKASVFSIAAGAQETTRLLLLNPQLFASVGGPPDALGRYYQGHVSGKIASVHFCGSPRKTDFGFQRQVDGVYVRRRFQLTREALLQHNLLNTAIWLDNPLYFNPAHRNGAMSVMYLAMITPGLGKRLAPPAVAHSITKGKRFGVRQHFWNVIKDAPGSLITPASIFFRRYCLKRKLPGVFLYSPQNRYALHFHAEQVPHPENRMQLSPDGKNLLINYKITDADVDSVIKTHELLDAQLRTTGCGELDYWFPKAELHTAIHAMSKDGVHQVGTTRIAPDAAHGVVNENLKVWGTKNIYVCSSSAFPTSGQANPTFLLGAFAIRLAHHLKSAYAQS